MLGWKRNSHQNVKVFYRLDFRSPEIILAKGFKGTQTRWMNNVFGESSVFAAKSLRGVSRFFLESVMNKHVDGSNRSGSLSSKRYLYPDRKRCYVYKINATSLEFLDVADDLKHVMRCHETSRLYNYNIKMFSLNNVEGNETSLDDIHFDIALRLNRYNHNLVTHTEEVIIRGPISPKRITLYQTL